MAETKKKPPAKKKKPAAKKKVKEPVVVEEVVEEVVVEPDMSVVPLDFGSDETCDCGDVCDKCFIGDECHCEEGDTCDICFVEVTEEPESEPQPEEALADEPQPPVSEEVKPKRQGRRPAVPFVRISGRPVSIRM